MGGYTFRNRMALCPFGTKGPFNPAHATRSPEGLALMTTLRFARPLQASAFAAVAVVIAGAAAAQPGDQPNILLIVADDAGYSDIGAFGGEIATPNLDALADVGMRFTNFLTGAASAPTRAMLLSGTDHHLAGHGNAAGMLAPNQTGLPGYEGVLNQNVVTISALLRDAGYNTFMAGEWNLGADPHSIPAARGFMHDLTLLSDGGSHLNDMWGASGEPLQYTYNGQPLDGLRPGFHSSTDYTDAIIADIDEHLHDGRPFFAYLALQAPAGPFQLPAAWRDIYNARYDAGYDVIRAERIARMQTMGIIARDATVSPRLPSVPAWADLSSEERRQSARRMELYAGMVTHMDASIGELLDFLRLTNQFDNTIIIFLSDNGPNGALDPVLPPWDNSDMADWGRAGTYIQYGPAWAQVSAGPFRMFKDHLTEGGLRSPMIIAGPGVAGGGQITDALTHVMDVPATILDMAGVSYPDRYDGNRISPLQGLSLAPLLADPTAAPRGPDDWIGFELAGNRALRQGDWKLFWHCDPAGSGHWELFNLRDDPAEIIDLADINPDIRDHMAATWDSYAATNNVILPVSSPVCDGLGPTPS